MDSGFNFNHLEELLKTTQSGLDWRQSTLYEKALRLMLEKHAGQVDKSGEDYRGHLLRVERNTQDFMICKEDCEAVRIVALLHDVVEDTDVTFDDLRAMGFPEDVVAGIASVTKREGEPYHEFVLRASSNKFGKIVKQADLKDNLNIFRLKNITEKDRVRLNKYLHSYRYLTTNDAHELDEIKNWE